MSDQPAPSLPPIPASGPVDRIRQAAVVSRWRASGLTQRAFAQAHGLNPRRLGRWCRTADQGMPSAEPSVPGFVEVRLEQPAAVWVEVVTGTGAVVRVGAGFDPALLRSVVAALG